MAGFFVMALRKCLLLMSNLRLGNSSYFTPVKTKVPAQFSFKSTRQD